MCAYATCRTEAPFSSSFKLPVVEKQTFGLQECIAGAIHLCTSGFILVLERLECISERAENYSFLCQRDLIPVQGEAIVLRILHKHIKTKK